ncbi:hypothetical protein Tco_1054807 [Tanacetum coccineum]|uniref:Uncharacterized protein n=1 Tax=Tanacetum coccineum TaxID=301880 RepID=A0ABQ5GXU9_9ASTR
MVPYEAFTCRCGAEDVVLRESYKHETRGSSFESNFILQDFNSLTAILQELQHLKAILWELQEMQSAQTASTCYDNDKLKFNLEANAEINFSFKLSSFDFAVDITDDTEVMCSTNFIFLSYI